MSTRDRAIYYAVGDDLVSRSNTKKSIESLRRFDSAISVYVFLHGRCPEEERQFYRKHRVALRARKRRSHDEPVLWKWLALKHLREERVLYLDSSLAFFRDPGIIFSELSKRDLLAGRLERRRDNWLVSSRT